MRPATKAASPRREKRTSSSPSHLGSEIDFRRSEWLIRKICDLFDVDSEDAYEIAPELTGQGHALGKCEAYDRPYDQHRRSVPEFRVLFVLPLARAKSGPTSMPLAIPATSPLVFEPWRRPARSSSAQVSALKSRGITAARPAVA